MRCTEGLPPMTDIAEELTWLAILRADGPSPAGPP